MQALNAIFARKLNKAAEIIGPVNKTGKNKNQGYTYVEESHLVESVQKAFSAVGLAFSTRVKGRVVAEIPTAKHTPEHPSFWYKTTVELVCVLTDTETGFEKEYDWYGEGIDPGDKGLYKAYTSGIKYFLMKTLLVPTGDDVEAGDDMPEDNGNGKNGNGKSRNPYPKPGEKFEKPGTPTNSPPPANPEALNGVKLPPIPAEAEPVMQALEDYYKAQDTDHYRFNPDKLRKAVWTKYGKWPTTQAGATKIKSEIMALDCADEA